MFDTSPYIILPVCRCTGNFLTYSLNDIPCTCISTCTGYIRGRSLTSCSLGSQADPDCFLIGEIPVLWVLDEDR